MFGIFGDLFDFNNDGKLNFTEQAMEIAALHQMIDRDKNSDDTLSIEDIDNFDLLDEDY